VQITWSWTAFEDAVAAITPSTLTAICWEQETPMGSLGDLGKRQSLNLKIKLLWHLVLVQLLNFPTFKK